MMDKCKLRFPAQVTSQMVDPTYKYTSEQPFQSVLKNKFCFCGKNNVRLNPEKKFLSFKFSQFLSERERREKK